MLADPRLADPTFLRIMALRRKKRLAGGEVVQPMVPIAWQPMWAASHDGIPTPQAQGYASPADILFFGGAAGGGKALALDTLLPTPSGWTFMADVQIGDWLFDERGTPCQVLQCSDIMEERPCYEVLFSDKSRIVADVHHLWQTFTLADRDALHRRSETFRANRRAKRPSRATGRNLRPHVAVRNMLYPPVTKAPPIGHIFTTEQLEKTCLIRGRVNHSVPVAAALNLPAADLLVPPYVLGAWLGDGTTLHGSITGIDRQILDEIERAGYEILPRKDPKNFGISGAQVQLRRIDVLGNKHIPQIYLRASVAQRLDLLQGLMDTDGTVDDRGQCTFTTTLFRLARGMDELLHSLGIKAHACEGRAMLDGRDCGPVWDIKFLTDLPVFRLERKAHRQKRSNFRGTHTSRYIVAVNPVPSVPVRCVMVDSPSHLYLAGSAMIPTHNSDLLLGLAGTAHRKSIIFRREFPQMLELRERSRTLFGPYGRFNGQEQVWHLKDGRILEFGAVQHEKFVEKYQGRPHDFLGFDELTHLLESQYRFLLGWMRTTTPGQRCRVVATGNPPTSAEGEWIIQYWGPWLDPQHPYPAVPGELRWYATVDGKDVERQDGTTFEHKGELLTPMSRTFIPSRVEDNPYLMASGYKTVLQNLPEPLRSKMLHGDFSAGMEDNPWQVIPTAWVDAAMARWTEAKPDIPLSALGVDIARGGKDQTVIAKRYGPWFPRLKKYPGIQTPNGPSVAALVVIEHEGQAAIQMDIIGVGGAGYDYVKEVKPDCTVAMNGAHKSTARDHSDQLHFRNKRAEWHWKLREALDPVHGDMLALPPDREMRADLIAPRWKLSAQGIQIEEKDDIKARLGRSPDSGEAVIYAHAQERARWLPVGD